MSARDGYVQGIPELAKAIEDLVRLTTLGMLSGVAQVIGERRRQVEELGYTAEHDDRHGRDDLVQYAADALCDVLTGHPHYRQEAMRQAGALAAAEIDRAKRGAGQ